MVQMIESILDIVVVGSIAVTTVISTHNVCMLSIVADWQPKYWIDCDEGQTMFVIDTKQNLFRCHCYLVRFHPQYLSFAASHFACSACNIYTFDLQLSSFVR